MGDLTDNQRAIVKEVMERLKSGIRIHKITCTRSVKGRFGDTYVGFSAGWSSVQDDVGGATDAQIQVEPEQPTAERGLDLKEANLVTHMVAMDVDLMAHDNAMAGGNITNDDRQKALSAIRSNYTRLITEKMLSMGFLDEEEA